MIIDYVKADTMQRYSAETLRTLMGIDIDNAERVKASGFLPVINTYPEHDPTLYYTREREGGLKAVEGGYVREHMLVAYDLDTAKARMKARIAAMRWERETGGIEIDGMEILTGAEDLARLTATLNGLTAAGLADTSFKAVNGWATVTLEELKAIQAAIVTFTEACFAEERRLDDAVDACGSVAELAALDLESGWPDRKVE